MAHGLARARTSKLHLNYWMPDSPVFWLQCCLTINTHRCDWRYVELMEQNRTCSVGNRNIVRQWRVIIDLINDRSLHGLSNDNSRNGISWLPCHQQKLSFLGTPNVHTHSIGSFNQDPMVKYFSVSCRICYFNNIKWDVVWENRTKKWRYTVERVKKGTIKVSIMGVRCGMVGMYIWWK